MSIVQSNKTDKHSLTSKVNVPNIIIHKKSAVCLSNGPLSKSTPYLALHAITIRYNLTCFIILQKNLNNS